MKAILEDDTLSLETGAEAANPAGNRRVQLLAHARELWPGRGGHDEIQAHFACMPDHYWQRVTEGDLIGDLAAVHAFLSRLAASQQATPPVAVVWQHFPESGFTRLRVCSWDCCGLLAKIAAALGAMRLNVIRADVHTRSDHVVLDVFDVCGEDDGHIKDTSRLDSIAFLVEGALSQPPRFASVWSTQYHKVSPRHEQIIPAVQVVNQAGNRCTVVQVEAGDRPGLLFDILSALAGCGLNIEQAFVTTADGMALDAFHVTDESGSRVTQVEIHGRIISAVTASILG